VFGGGWRARSGHQHLAQNSSDLLSASDIWWKRRSSRTTSSGMSFGRTVRRSLLLHDAPLFPPEIPGGNPVGVGLEGLAFDLISAHTRTSRQSRACDFSGRDRIAKSPIATLTRCDSRGSDRGASPGPAPLTPQRLVQYAGVVVLHSSPFVELVGNLADSRYAVSEHPDKGVQKRACQQRTTFRVDDSLAGKA
jgi:hypothetical protein